LNNPQQHIKDFFDAAKLERTGSEFPDNGLKWYFASCVAVWALFAPVGCFLGATMASRVGRKMTMLSNNFLLCVGTLLQSCCVPANSYEMFFIGRIIMGIQNGVSTAVCPMYLSEIAPKSIRGGIGVVFQLTVVLGILIAQVLGFEIVLGSDDLWPQLLNINLVFGFIQCVCLPFCPRSPRFLLIENGDRNEARRSLEKLRGHGANVEEELEEIMEEDRKEKSEPPVTYSDLLRVGYLRRPLILSCMMAMSQQLSGINAINYYSAPIFEATLPSSLVDDDPDFPKYLVAVSGLVNLVVTTLSIFTVDRLGRRISHILGLSGMAVCALVVGLLLSGLEIGDQTCHGITVGDAGHYTAIVFIFISIAFFSIGPGAIPWLIIPELFTSSPRPKAASIANTVNWMCNFAIALGFDPIRDAICGWVFLIFFALLVFFVTYFMFRLPEIKGKSVNEIVQMFADKKRSRTQSETRPLREMSSI